MKARVAFLVVVAATAILAACGGGAERRLPVPRSDAYTDLTASDFDLGTVFNKHDDTGKIRRDQQRCVGHDNAPGGKRGNDRKSLLSSSTADGRRDAGPRSKAERSSAGPISRRSR